MSVNKLNNIEYLALSVLLKDSNFAKDNNYGMKEIYNVCYNLNVLGLCERYEDLFASSWKDDKIVKFEDVYREYADNISEKDINVDILRNNLDIKIKNSTDDSLKDHYQYLKDLITRDEEESYLYKNDIDHIFSSLHYNSIDNNELLTGLYKEVYENLYNSALSKIKYNRDTKDEEIIKYYPLNVNEETLAPKGDLSIYKQIDDWLNIPDYNYRYNFKNGDAKTMIESLSKDEINDYIDHYIARNITCKILSNNTNLISKNLITYDYINNSIDITKDLLKKYVDTMYYNNKNIDERKEKEKEIQSKVDSFTKNVFKDAYRKGLLNYEKHFKNNMYIPQVMNKRMSNLDSLKLTVIAKQRGYNDDRWIPKSLINNEKTNLSLADENAKGVIVKVGSPYIELQDGSKSYLTAKEASELKKEEIAKVKYSYRFESLYNASQVNGISEFKEQFFKYEPKVVNNIVKNLDLSKFDNDDNILDALSKAQKDTYFEFKEQKENKNNNNSNSNDLNTLSDADFKAIDEFMNDHKDDFNADDKDISMACDDLIKDLDNAVESKNQEKANENTQSNSKDNIDNKNNANTGRK